MRRDAQLASPMILDLASICHIAVHQRPESPKALYSCKASGLLECKLRQKILICDLDACNFAATF